MFKRESSLVLHDGRLVDFSIGTSASVEFNFDRIWTYVKNHVVIKDRTINLMFIHVHPPSFGPTMSSTDENCLVGLTYALGFSPGFAIVSFENNTINDIAGLMKLYTYEKGQMVMWDDKSNRVDFDMPFLTTQIPNKDWHTPFALLKRLSYDT